MIINVSYSVVDLSESALGFNVNSNHDALRQGV